MIHIFKKLKKDQLQLLVAFSIIALTFGLGLGILISDSRVGISGSQAADHDPDGNNHADATPHAAYNVSARDAPSVTLRVEEDSKSGWNLTLETTNFTFAPEHVGEDNILGEGHAHLYVDGVKVARLYGNHFHYGEDFDGSREFRVTLNANDHSEYALDGQVIEATRTVTHGHN